ncbi:MAG: ubiquitin-like protein Pup [Ignavibacteriales bacterium]|nr:ubiquitin-like protein Pup [Ignavibacteriales bacterium]
MNRRQLNKKRMYFAVNGTLKDNSVIVDAKVKLKEYHQKLQSKLTELDKAEVIINKAAAGVTKTKNDLKLELIKTFLPLKAVLNSYGTEKKRNDILALVKISESDLKKMNDTQLTGRISSVLVAAKEVLTELADYEIDADVITGIQSASDLFSGAIDKMGGGESQESSARDEVDKLFDEIDEILNEHLDSFVEMLREKEPNFYNAYYSARVIKDLGGSHGVEEGNKTVETTTDNK